MEFWHLKFDDIEENIIAWFGDFDLKISQALKWGKFHSKLILLKFPTFLILLININKITKRKKKKKTKKIKIKMKMIHLMTLLMMIKMKIV